MSAKKRTLLDITLEEAIEVIKLGGGFSPNVDYKLRKGKNPFGEPFMQLYYMVNSHTSRPEETIAANFTDDENGVSLCEGNKYFRTLHRIVRYLDKRGIALKEDT